MSDISHELTLDGSAVAGLLGEVFGGDMTGCPCQCATAAPSARWPRCSLSPTPRALCCAVPAARASSAVVRTDEAVYLDARGAAYLKRRREGQGGACRAATPRPGPAGLFSGKWPNARRNGGGR